MIATPGAAVLEEMLPITLRGTELATLRGDVALCGAVAIVERVVGAAHRGRWGELVLRGGQGPAVAGMGWYNGHSRRIG